MTSQDCQRPGRVSSNRASSGTGENVSAEDGVFDM